MVSSVSHYSCACLQSAAEASCAAAEYISSSRLYQAGADSARFLQRQIVKVLDVVLPRNPVTQRREFRFIPTWVENWLGASSYDSVCPTSKIAPPSTNDKVHAYAFTGGGRVDKKNLIVYLFSHA